MNDKKEILGRLYLWKVAIDRVFELLKFKEKFERFNKTGRPKYIRDLYDEERERLNNWLELEGEELDNFEEKNGSLFPDLIDINIIGELVTEEIIIKFCTIFNTGYGKSGTVAKNTKYFYPPIIDTIVLEAFSGDVKDKFKKFIDDAIEYRDKQAAHFDEVSFGVEHGNKQSNEDGLIYRIGWSNALLIFDWDFVSDTIPIFRKSLNIYIEKLQKEVGII